MFINKKPPRQTKVFSYILLVSKSTTNNLFALCLLITTRFDIKKCPQIKKLRGISAAKNCAANQRHKLCEPAT